MFQKMLQGGGGIVNFVSFIHTYGFNSGASYSFECGFKPSMVIFYWKNKYNTNYNNIYRRDFLEDKFYVTNESVMEKSDESMKNTITQNNNGFTVNIPSSTTSAAGMTVYLFAVR